MTSPHVRPAARDDCPLLVDLMEEFYAESAYPLNRARATAAFDTLLEDPRLGRVFIVAVGDQAAGYVVLTVGYSMEYGGRDGFVDDLFIRAPFRGQGLGALAIAAVRAACRDYEVRALHLEVAPDNARAQALYRRSGFVATGRQLLTLRLADPTHHEPQERERKEG